MLLRGLLDEAEEARFHLLSVDDEGSSEYLVAAMFRVDLGESEDFGVGQRPSVLLFYLVQVFYLLGGEGQPLFFVVFLDVLHMPDRLWSVVYGEDILVQTVVHALQHRVVLGILRTYGKVFLNTRNAAKTHILGNLNGIRAPWGDHLAAGAYIVALQFLGV